MTDDSKTVRVLNLRDHDITLHLSGLDEAVVIPGRERIGMVGADRLPALSAEVPAESLAKARRESKAVRAMFDEGFLKVDESAQSAEADQARATLKVEHLTAAVGALVLTLGRDNPATRSTLADLRAAMAADPSLAPYNYGEWSDEKILDEVATKHRAAPMAPTPPAQPGAGVIPLPGDVAAVTLPTPAVVPAPPAKTDEEIMAELEREEAAAKATREAAAAGTGAA